MWRRRTWGGSGGGSGDGITLNVDKMDVEDISL